MGSPEVRPSDICFLWPEILFELQTQLGKSLYLKHCMTPICHCSHVMKNGGQWKEIFSGFVFFRLKMRHLRNENPLFAEFSVGRAL